MHKKSAMRSVQVELCWQGLESHSLISETKQKQRRQIRQSLHEYGSTSSWFHDFETESKSMRFESVYTEPFSPEN